MRTEGAFNYMYFVRQTPQTFGDNPTPSSLIIGVFLCFFCFFFLFFFLFFVVYFFLFIFFFYQKCGESGDYLRFGINAVFI